MEFTDLKMQAKTAAAADAEAAGLTDAARARPVRDVSGGRRALAAEDSPRRRASHTGLSEDAWARLVQGAAGRSISYLLDTRHPDGWWWQELESNCTITSEYVMMFHLMGIVDREREARIVRHLLHEQRPNGSWGLYAGDDGDLSTTIEAYFALKLGGEDPSSEPMRRAHSFICARGGIQRSRVFTKIWLALFGQYEWDNIPSMPVEIMLLPPWLLFSVYEFSSWARSTVVPLSIIMAIRPTLSLPEHLCVPELSCPHEPDTLTDPRSGLHQIFLWLDRGLKWFESHPAPFIRKRGLRAAEKWILQHQEESGDWGGIQPAMLNSVLALFYLGYPANHPVITRGLEALENFCLEDERGLRLQACVSPVWDTALNCLALVEAGLDPCHPALQKAVSWLISKQVNTRGDWQVKNPAPPGGWAFEFFNTWYPDVDDSAVVLMVLHRLSETPCEGIKASCAQGMRWCLSMQSSCGGWAAFDKDNTMTLLNRIPFADHEAMVDFPTADITGRMLEAMGLMGYPITHPRAQSGLRFIRRMQEEDGCWWGRWGVNYVYGTWCVLRGLSAIGEDMGKAYVREAVKWLKSHQNLDGGWGETCESYRCPELRGRGPSTASQTAWAIMALLTTAGGAESQAVRRGVDYLVRHQTPEGSWEEPYATGTGFPGHFYIRYHNYRDCFPLMALGQYARHLKEPRKQP